LVNDGIDGFWNDMNEPAMWGKHIPASVEFNFDGRKATVLSARNVYGMEMARSTSEGVIKLINNQRPFILTRAAYAGIQRYSSIWTGDNNPTDDHMLTGVRLVNSLGLSGVPFAGADISGYTGNASAELYTRWMSIGVFTPLFRSHKSINANESEPWSYGLSTEALVCKYIQLRYDLMPYLYSTFYETMITGLPVSRSLAFGNCFDNAMFDTKFENEFTFGDAFLIAPCKSNESMIKVFLPKGMWYDFYNDEKLTGENIKTIESPLNRLPVFVKAGGIIPRQKPMQNTSENPGDTLFLHIYFAEQNIFSFDYYDDDGVTYGYSNSVYSKRKISYLPSEKKITIDESSGNFVSPFKIIKLTLHGFSSFSNPLLNKTITLPVKSETHYCMINNESSQVITTSFQYTNHQITIQW